MKTITLLIIGCMILAMNTGCAPTRTEKDFGASYNLAKYNQIANPQAEKNLEPVKGLDGQAAGNAVEKYRKEFEKPAPAPSLNISFGSK